MSRFHESPHDRQIGLGLVAIEDVATVLIYDDNRNDVAEDLARLVAGE